MESVLDVCPLRHLFLRDNKERKRKVDEKNVTGMLAGLSVLCFRQCPWYLECIVMYARYEFCVYMRWAAEAELLVLLRIWSILLNGDRWLKGRQGMWFNKTALYFG